MLFKRKKTARYYIDVIEGKRDLSKFEITNKQEEIHEDRVLSTAFEELKNIADTESVAYLLTHLDDDIDTYSVRKQLALQALGHVADSCDEQEINKYRQSKNCDLAYGALSAMCDIYERRKLSTELERSFREYMIALVDGDLGSYEDVIVCAVALKRSGDVEIEPILERLGDSNSDLSKDIKGLL